MLKDIIVKGGCCDDYSLLTAYLQTISYLNTSGEQGIFCFSQSEGNGTIIRSITITAELPDGASPLTFNPGGPGMVQMTINDALYEEILIPVFPSLPFVSLPIPVLPTFAVTLTQYLLLAPGDSLCFVIKSAYKINIIVEEVAWAYPETVPEVCCSFMEETATTGIGIISDDNPVVILTADGNGTYLKSVTIKALQSTHEGMVKLYIDGALFKEVCVPQTNQSAFESSFKKVAELDFCLAAGNTISAATVNAESFAITVEGVSWGYPV